ncbi:ABC transporter substrate-binding protein [Streptomyces spiramenti]|uniref:ABC transporter substrate-binding protein n=1 Tax=Streptomyces spiramenti TaxID=2720606 RepID=A0ABX1APP7_9ACTN|nr:ABC transporter substrate-binding protein [Streptomyces spiramenti]NJP67050.1 ABC transporter substrate-binding protein [Streptomyces spiramenti]
MRPASRSAAAALALAALLLTSCSSADTSDGDGSGAGGGGDAATADADGTRTVTTDYGDVDVPTAPERVVVLNYALAGYLYNLDVPVVAVTPEDADQDEGSFSEFWAEDAEDAGTEFLPWTVDGFDLESVLEAEPDLIVAGGLGFPLGQAEQVYDELTGIAPTVLVGGGLTTWQDQFSFLAEDVFAKDDTYRELLAAHEERVEEVREAITPPPAPAAYVTFTADQSPYVLIEDRGLPAELAAVGIEPAPVFAEGDFEPYTSGGDMFTLSTEEVAGTLDQPTLFVTGFNADTTDVATLSGNAVYASLPSFASGDAHDLPYWVVRADYDESLALLDIIEELFS